MSSSVDELAAHYAHASKGRLDLAVLIAIADGYAFERVANVFGLRAVWGCVVRGWIDHGKLTDAGRDEIRKAADA